MMLFLTIIGMLTLVQPTYASQRSIVTSDEGCKLLKPTQSFGNTVKWDGQCVDGYAQGKGSAQWYIGDTLASIYSGVYTKGGLNGEGTIDWKIVSKCEVDYYKGGMENSDQMGQGEMLFIDGNRFIGKISPKSGNVYGIGTFAFGKDSDYFGDIYEGELLNSKFSGNGTYTWGEQSYWAGDAYTGEYKNNKHHGQGIYVSARSQTRYEGSWKEGVKEGQGTESFVDFTYTGEWKNNHRHGYGIGKWQSDKKDVYDIIYTGNWVYGNRQGLGKIKFSNGNWYKGEFKHNKSTGEGVSGRANGILYKGSHINGKAWGYGKLTAPREDYDVDRRSKNGYWQKDTFIEEGWFHDNKHAFNCNNLKDCQKVAEKNPKYKKMLAEAIN